MKKNTYIDADYSIPIFTIIGFDGSEICKFFDTGYRSLQKIAGIKHNRCFNKPIVNILIDWGVK